MLEDEVQQLIRIDAAKHGITLFRNNNGAFTDQTGRTIRFGLGNDSKKISENFKSSDLIGIYPIAITPEMVGRTVGIFIAVECKKESWNEKVLDKRGVAQKNYIDFIRSKGGFAGFANSIDMFRKLIGK